MTNPEQSPDPKPPEFPAHASARWELVTPEAARRYLATMHANRSVSRLEVGVQVENLREGTFYPAISPVFLDDADRAWDGQHRFQAIADTGVPAYLLFVRGVKPHEAESIDTGRRRSYADSLRIISVPDYKRQSVLARYLAVYDRYGIDGVRAMSKVPVTRAQLGAWIDAPGVHEAIKVGEALYRAVGANPTLASYAAMRTGDGLDPDGFWESVRSGTGLEAGDPALTLRNWLLQRRKRDRVPADRRLMELYGITTAWNKHVLGQPLGAFRPTFELRKDGTRFFPASHVPDFLLAPEHEANMRRLKDVATTLRSRR